MTCIRRFECNDLFKMGNVNLDALTETYNISFYLQYMATWPDYFTQISNPSNTIMGYILNKAEGDGVLWHGHVSALTIAPEFRRLGLAKKLMSVMEQATNLVYNAYFVDLFVRKSNVVAIKMYQSFGYTTYRRVLDYYGGGGEQSEDALDMRKAMDRDVDKKSVIPLGRPIRPDELEWH